MSCKVNHTVSLFCVLLLTVEAIAAEPGLVGWWRLDDGAGTTAADSSDGGHNGSFITGNATWVQGKFGGALKFEGTAQVEIPDHADFHFEDAVSIALWANPEAVQQTDSKFFCKQKSTYYPYAIQYNSNAATIFANVSNASTQFNTKPSIANFPGEWAHLCSAYDGNALILYKNGLEVARVAGSGKIRQNTLSLTIGGRLGYTTSNNFQGMIDDVRLYSRALTPQDIALVMQGPPTVAASKPSPAVGAVDVLRDVVLNWAPAAPGMVHDIYFGSVPADVTGADRANPKGVLVGQAQDANTYDPPGLLPLGQMYYWRVDEVNTVTSAINKGMIWSFTTEPVAYAIKPVAVTASSSQSTDNGPEKTVDGSGLNAADQHSTLDTAMWISSLDGPKPAWIRYDFDGICKLYQMWVWNSNQPVEMSVGYGAKDVTVEYSVDGDTWTTVPGVSQFARATGKADYAHNTTVDFGGVAARSVRITVQSNWGGLLSQYSLSEVRFLQIPTRAREPQPASGQTDVNPSGLALHWRSGREAVSHQVFFSTDSNAVVNGTALIDTTGENSYVPNALDLGKTYSWRIDEVNQAASPALWQGDVWTFSTAEYLVIDDFERYTNDSPNRVFQTWLDGVGFSPDGSFPNGYAGNNTGSVVGYDPQAGDIMEKTIVHGGKQSMPLAYDNTTVGYSEVERTWKTAQNWAANGASVLRLFFQGRPIGFQERSPTNIVMSGAGTDIFNTADQGHFVYKQLAGDGWISARVDSLVDTDPWAKAGVMIRRSTDAGASYAYVSLSGNNGVRFQARTVVSTSATSDSTVATPEQKALAEPVWVKVERLGTTFNGYYSTDNKVWTPMVWNPQTITMGDTACIGLAVTSHAATATTTAEFSNISTSSSVSGSWTSADLGVPQLSNTPDQLYVTLKDASGRTGTVLADADAVLKGTWQAWSIPLSSFAGISMNQVQSMIIGVGDRTSPKHGQGVLFIDDIAVGHPAQ
jgi:regulation of enolase protein 1 (concanavalin A-like superfamily)